MRVYKTSEETRRKALAYYYAHRKQIIKRITAKQATPEGKALRKRQYKKRGTAYHVAKTQAWRDSNPEKFKRNYKNYVNARRARLANAAGKFSYEGWLVKVSFYGWRCIYCNLFLDESTLTIEHKIPLSKGGTNWLSNLAPACGPCNSSKAAKVNW